MPHSLRGSVRPASAGTSREFPDSKRRNGRNLSISSTYVTFYGQAVYEGETQKGNAGGLFGSWQGKKYSMAGDTFVKGGGDSGTLHDMHGHHPSRHVSFLDRNSRTELLDAAKDRTASQIREVEMNVGAGAGPTAFIPRIRPKSARASFEAATSWEAGFLPGSTGERDPLSPLMPQPTRLPNKLGIPRSSGHLLSDLNLPSMSEVDVAYNLPIEPISTSLSVDGEVALLRLSEAGPGAKFCDSGFEAGISVLQARKVDGKSAERLVEAVAAWKRPQELGLKSEAILYNENSVKVSDVLQGALGNCYLLGAMSVIATRKDHLQQIWSHFQRIDPTLSNKSLMDKGIFTVQLYKDCMWHDVTVDTRIPCRLDPNGNFVPAFGKCVSNNHMWVPLLEKAFAKLYGGYGALEGGSLTEAMADLTGGVTHTYNLVDKNVEDLVVEGGLWRELQELCSEGSLAACSRNSRAEGAEVEGPLGLLTNHAYAILDVKTLPDSGHRLLLVRDPWGVGTFTGKWREKSDMWKVFPSASQHLGQVPAEGSGSFWMSFEEFVENMTTVHICRIFPAHYHSLSVKSEWDLSTAGGPPDSGFWFQNPQFRVCVAQNATVVFSVVQFDRKIPGRTHSAVMTGLVVLKARRGTYPVRMWDVQRDLVVATLLPSFGREVSISVRLVQGCLYYVVPFTSLAGIEAPFMLRCYSSAMVELQRVAPAALSQVRGHWLGHYAGGRRPAATWCKNPQFLLTAHVDEDVMLVLQRGAQEEEKHHFEAQDLQHHILGSEVGIALMKTKEGQRVKQLDDAELEIEAGFMRSSEASFLYRLRAGRKIVVVPSTVRPGISAPFTLSCYSEGPVTLRKLADERRSVLAGEWTEETSGGAHVHESWARNPSYHLHVPPPCAFKPSITINLSLVPISSDSVRWNGKSAWASRQRKDPLGTMIGIYVMRSPINRAMNVHDLNSRVMETTFVPAERFSITLDLPPSPEPYVIVPATYGAGLTGVFYLEVMGNVEFIFVKAPLLVKPPLTQKRS